MGYVTIQLVDDFSNIQQSDKVVWVSNENIQDAATKWKNTKI